MKKEDYKLYQIGFANGYNASQRDLKKNQKSFWCLVNKRGSFITINGQLPIFWNRRVAKEEAQIYKCEAKKIYLNSPVIENPDLLPNRGL